MPSLTFGRRVQMFFSYLWFSCFKCWQRLRCQNLNVEVKDHFEILCLGLSKAGKTSILSTLVGESVEDIQPTTGFNTKNLTLRDISINIKEIGGSDSVRPFWSKYYDGINGLIYVIDGSSSDDVIDKSMEELKKVLSSHSIMNNLPCLILCTHKDLDEMRTLEQLTEALKKVELNMKKKKYWIVHLCSIFEPSTVKDGIDQLLVLLNSLSPKRILAD